MYKTYDPDLLREKISSFHPQIIAFSAISPEIQFVKRLLQDVDTKGIFTILGGPHATLAPECLEEIQKLDAICRGEGEEPLRELVRALEEGRDVTGIRNLWAKKNGQIRRNPTRPFTQDLDELPFPDRELFDYRTVIRSNYNRADFMASRGCPYNCHYCSNHVFRKLQEGKYVRFRSVENVILEIKDVTARYPIKIVFMQDDCFMFRKDYVFEFCDAYKQEISVPFMMHTRPEDVNRDMLRALKSAGCFRMAMGIESGSEYIRKEMLNRQMTNEQIRTAFRLAKDEGFVTKSFNIVGFPVETKEHFQETIKINQEVKPDLFTLTIFHPYPGTRLYELCREKGYLTDRGERPGFIARTDTVLDMPQFTRKEILRCYRNFAFHIYKHRSLLKALVYKVYYSRFGERLIRLLAPLKTVVFTLAERRKG